MVFITSVLKVLSLYTAFTMEKCREHISAIHTTIQYHDFHKLGDDWDTAVAFYLGLQQIWQKKKIAT